VRQRRSIEHLAYALRACPRDVPEPPSTANDRHQQQLVNMRPAQALNPRPTHGNTLVICSSLGGDEDQGAEVASRHTQQRQRVRCVPDRPVNGGNLRSLADSQLRSSEHMKAPEGADSQAGSASSIPITRCTPEGQARKVLPALGLTRARSLCGLRARYVPVGSTPRQTALRESACPSGRVERYLFG
jgi:hypothetical protein